MATFSSHAGMKLRLQELAAGAVTAFIQTDRHAAVEQYAACRLYHFPVATHDTREIAQAASWCLDKIYPKALARESRPSKKAGGTLPY